MNTTTEIVKHNPCIADERLVLEAANGNPGGATSAAISIEKLVCLMARAYMTTLQAEEVK